MKTLKSLIGKLWASPNTIVGLIAGFGFYYYSIYRYCRVVGFKYPDTSYSWDPPKITFGNNALQFHNLYFPGRTNRGAITIGNTILYFLCDSDAVFDSYCKTFKVNVGRHEGMHTHHAEVLGIFYYPVWKYRGGAVASNKMEQEADKAGRV